ncbi:polysaccharide pyruvyl transferase family protein [Catenovulum agarivorans]|uniref:polysaccharide pyruvyl transferase family protein n=1 Tax=Catenovulum agarivorans TaxID=1172192 RepID=UPI0002F69955|nr:polysaccharide pyruvyl transferase family protein [Catenovulum agarivorans]
MKVTFSGFYGMSNTGDDCFCKIAEWGAKHYWNADTSYFFSKKIPQLSPSSKPILKQLPHHRLGFINKFLADNHFKKNNHLVFAGGSIFHGKEWWEMDYAKQNLDRFKLKVGAIGVSVGPFDSVNHEKKVIEFMKNMSFISVRDQKSYDIVKSYNLDLPCINSFDLAALLPRVEPCTTSDGNSSEVTIGLALCSFNAKSAQAHHDNQSRLELLASAINRLNILRNNQLKTKLFVFHGHEAQGDLATNKMLANLLDPSVKYEICHYHRDPMDMWHQIGSCDAVLSFRLHGAIYSFMAQVPFLLAEVHEKATNFLDDINWSDQLRVGDFEVSTDELVDRIELMLQPHDFTQDVERCILKAEKNFTEAVFD